MENSLQRKNVLTLIDCVIERFYCTQLFRSSIDYYQIMEMTVLWGGGVREAIVRSQKVREGKNAEKRRFIRIIQYLRGRENRNSAKFLERYERYRYRTRIDFDKFKTRREYIFSQQVFAHNMSTWRPV